MPLKMIPLQQTEKKTPATMNVFKVLKKVLKKILPVEQVPISP